MNFKKEMAEEKAKMEQVNIKIAKNIEKMEEERKKLEDVRKQIEKNYELLMVEAKKRPEAEAEMFKRVTKKLEAERKLMATERQNIDTEFRKKVCRF